MKNMKQLLLYLLSNSINLRRDKPILDARITILVTSIFLLGIYYIGFTDDFHSELTCWDYKWLLDSDWYLFAPFAPFSEQWCKEKKVELYKNGFPAVFEDMSKIKNKDYFAINKLKLGEKPLSFYSLKNIPGIYMITNKITKKFYIGMTTDLKSRFYNYTDEKRLNRDRSSRINKALLKFGFDKFSISILEFTQIKEGTPVKSSFLREREDFFIKVFKPQYNIKRSTFNMDYQIGTAKIKTKIIIPTKIKNLLDKCLDPDSLDWNLIQFNFNSRKRFYHFAAITPKCAIKASSEGWFKGDIQKDIGFKATKVGNISKEKIILCYSFIDKEKLAHFYHKEKTGFIKERLALKIKALKLKANI